MLVKSSADPLEHHFRQVHVLHFNGHIQRIIRKFNSAGKSTVTKILTACLRLQRK